MNTTIITSPRLVPSIRLKQLLTMAIDMYRACEDERTGRALPWKQAVAEFMKTHFDDWVRDQKATCVRQALQNRVGSNRRPTAASTRGRAPKQSQSARRAGAAPFARGKAEPRSARKIGRGFVAFVLDPHHANAAVLADQVRSFHWTVPAFSAGRPASSRLFRQRGDGA